ncbi:MAG: hypothetical protein GF334_12320 [Candidatus Altiarchaeales archaeon]|nr:hypothetical protein [Candidatus Altiarchaeales archaeon]
MSIGLGIALSPNNAALYATVVAWMAAVPLTWEYVKNHKEPVDEAFKLGVWFAAVSVVLDLVLLTTAAEYTWVGFILNAGYKYPVLMLIAVATAEAQKQIQ